MTPTEYFHWNRNEMYGDHQEQAHQDREQSVLRDLAPEALGDVLRAERRRVDRVGQTQLELVLLGARQRLGADLEVRVLPLGRRAASLDHGAGLPDFGGLTPHLLERRRLGRAERDLRTAPEVDPEVQSQERDRQRPRSRTAHPRTRTRSTPADVVPAQPLRKTLTGGSHDARVLEPADPAQQARGSRASRRPRSAARGACRGAA